MAKSVLKKKDRNDLRMLDEKRTFEWYCKTFPKQFHICETVDDYFQEIESLLRKSAVAWIKIGIYLEDARKRLGKESFHELCDQLGINPTATAWRYRKMARHPWLSNPKNWPYLPANQAALLMIAKHEKELSPKKLDQLVQQQELHPAVEPRDIKAWLPAPEKNGHDVGYKPIARPIVMKFGGLPKDVEISERDWKKLDKRVQKVYQEWLKEITG